MARWIHVVTKHPLIRSIRKRRANWPSIVVFAAIAAIGVFMLNEGCVWGTRRNLLVGSDREMRTFFEAEQTIDSSTDVDLQLPTIDEEDFFRQMRHDWGKGGDAVHLGDKDKPQADKLFAQAAFNVFVSDRIPLNRTLPDVRPTHCRTVDYTDIKLPTASVVIIFFDEIFSALLRTVVTTIMRSPAHLLKEVILVDDFSQRPDLKHRLSRFISHHFRPGLVRLLRLPKRSGLIVARLAGAQLATGDVLIFLDSHCEATHGWLEPLLHPIQLDRRSVVTPVIDIIDEVSFQYLHFEEDRFQIGGFLWSGDFAWINMPDAWKTARASLAEPVPSPTMAGGLFAIHREYFWESGSYDEQMQGWGGENLEMSFRIWQCGGRILVAPCSHVGHIFRSFRPYELPGGEDTASVNIKRAFEVWADEFKENLYENSPELREVDAGDLCARKWFREQSQCRSFEWYLTNVYPQNYVPKKHSVAQGIVRNVNTSKCLDTCGTLTRLTVAECGLGDQVAYGQLMSFSKKGELRSDEVCTSVEWEQNADRELRNRGKVVMTPSV